MKVQVTEDINKARVRENEETASGIRSLTLQPCANFSFGLFSKQRGSLHCRDLPNGKSVYTEESVEWTIIDRGGGGRDNLTFSAICAGHSPFQFVYLFAFVCLTSKAVGKLIISMFSFVTLQETKHPIFPQKNL